MASPKIQQRRQAILRELNQGLHVPSFADEWGISTKTVYRDLAAIRDTGKALVCEKVFDPAVEGERRVVTVWRFDNSVGGSKGSLNANQVKILRVLRDAKKEIDRTAIKVGVGIGAKGKHSGSWLKSLWELQSRRLILINDYEDKRAYQHSITALGKKTLATAEKRSSSPVGFTPRTHQSDG